MSQNGQPHFSLLSLSIAAANAAPIPAELSAARSSQGATTNTTKHRRLSSAGRSRRRLSDARDAATRPFPASLQTASASLAALSLGTHTTASHCPVPGAQPIQVPRATSAKGTSEPEPASVDDDTHLSLSPPQLRTPLASNSVNVARSGRKRGTIFTCESCCKVYRHPSCLIKHRWEHTPQWREASKFVLSKHQQVQLLEAAAILSHLSPSSASLPEDRSLWPSFLSGGLVPPPALVSNGDVGSTSPLTTTTATATSPPASASHVHTPFPISSSVPASTVLDSYRAGSTGPRLHDYAIGGDGIGITQVRPGMLGVSTAPMSEMNGKSSPMPVSGATTTTTEDDALNLLALREASVTSGSWGSLTSASLSHSHSHSRSPSHVHVQAHAHSHSHSHSLSYSHSHSHSHSLSLPHASRERERRRSNAYEYGFVSGSGSGFRFGYDYKSGSSRYTYAPDSNGTWSLPNSSVRSKSGSSGSRSRSQSASESRSDDEDEAVFGDGVDVDLDLDLDGHVGLDLEGGARVSRGWVYGSRVHAWKTEDGEGGMTDLGVREDEQEDGEDEKSGGAEQTWDGMEMEMEMEMD